MAPAPSLHLAQPGNPGSISLWQEPVMPRVMPRVLPQGSCARQTHGDAQGLGYTASEVPRPPVERRTAVTLYAAPPPSAGHHNGMAP